MFLSRSDHKPRGANQGWTIPESPNSVRDQINQKTKNKQRRRASKTAARRCKSFNGNDSFSVGKDWESPADLMAGANPPEPEEPQQMPSGSGHEAKRSSMEREPSRVAVAKPCRSLLRASTGGLSFSSSHEPRTLNPLQRASTGGALSSSSHQPRSRGLGRNIPARSHTYNDHYGSARNHQSAVTPGQEHRGFRAIPPPQPTTTTPSDPDDTNMVEVQPGLKAPLRRTQETLNAIHVDFISKQDCLACTVQVYCIADAKYYICPICRETNPTFGDADYCHGVGLGFTHETLIMEQRQQRL